MKESPDRSLEVDIREFLLLAAAGLAATVQYYKLGSSLRVVSAKETSP
jgi:hypothetical protein